jgi:hypothetical protein
VLDLRAYMDESGTHGGPVVVVGGYLTNATEWEKFEAAWLPVLEREHIKRFHAADCMAQEREFDGWSWQRSDTVYKELISIINDHNLFATAIAIVTEDFRRLISPEERAQSGDEYHIAMQKCFGEFARLIKQGTSPDELIAYVFERQDEFAAWALKIFQDTLKRENGEQRFRLGSMAYGDGMKSVPLQAADIIVYEAYREMDRQIGKKYLTPNRYFSALTEKGAHYLGFFDAEKIEEILNAAKAKS